jgi:hypothetical protein
MLSCYDGMNGLDDYLNGAPVSNMRNSLTVEPALLLSAIKGKVIIFYIELISQDKKQFGLNLF